MGNREEREDWVARAACREASIEKRGVEDRGCPGGARRGDADCGVLVDGRSGGDLWPNPARPEAIRVRITVSVVVSGVSDTGNCGILIAWHVGVV